MAENNGWTVVTKVVALSNMANLTFFAAGRRRRIFRENGIFKIRFQARGQDIKRTTGSSIEAVAKMRARQIIEDELECNLSKPDATFDELITRFVVARRAKGRGTVANDSAFAKTLRSTFHLPMTRLARDVRPGDLLTWLSSQALARGWKNRTYNHYRLWLRQIFSLAVADRLIEPNDHPFKSSVITRRRPERVERNIPTAEQFGAIVSDVRAHDGEEKADFLEFLGLGGVGQAEAAALRCRDVADGKMRFVRRKTGRAFAVPIYAWLGHLIVRRLQMTNGNAESPVFTVTQAGQSLTRACRRLGLRPFTQRGLRAMLIKRLYDAGVPVKRIALWQGHGDGGRLIQEVYTEVFSDQDRDAELADLAKVGGSARPEDFPSATL
jgi:integrase